MKKKQYLQIAISGRGGIDDVVVIDSEGRYIDEYVQERYDRFVNEGEGEEDWEGYAEEFGSLDKTDWGWFVGLGEEDYWFVVDMECELFVNFENRLKEKYPEGWFSWNSVEDELYDLIDDLDYYV